MPTLTAEGLGKGTINFGCAVLAIGGTTDLVKTTGILNFMINGIMYTKAATDDNAWATGADAFTVIPIATSVLINICVDAAGKIWAVQGTGILTASISVTNPLRLPATKTGCCCIGYLRITTVGSTFTIDTTALTGVTTYVNLGHESGYTPLTS